VIGIALVTLRPGKMGGSETYARGLLRALERYGELEYRPLARGDPRLAGLDAVHYPFTVAYPRTKLPTAVTVHDVLHREPLRSPRRGVRRWTYDRSSRAARRVIVPSAFVSGRVQELLSVEPERIRVIHHGIDHDRFHPSGEARGGFLFYPANPWLHKNHARLFEAFTRLRHERPGLELVLTGTGFKDLPAGVRTVGRVGWGELPALYRRAGALVFPSLYEGFGLPPLEAMACGCPVASSTAGSLPEVCGDAAVYFDPTSVDEMVAAIWQALEGELVAKGLEQAARFTWEKCARGHDEVYRELTA
jgi:glycosyltransferase involved in cell wall biosynthesis